MGNNKNENLVRTSVGDTMEFRLAFFIVSNNVCALFIRRPLFPTLIYAAVAVENIFPDTATERIVVVERSAGGGRGVGVGIDSERAEWEEGGRFQTAQFLVVCCEIKGPEQKLAGPRTKYLVFVFALRENV